MSTRDTIHRRAQLFGWQRYDLFQSDEAFVRGDRRVYVHYGRNGSVVDARKTFGVQFRPGTEQLLEATGGRDKKEKVLSWLAETA